MAGTYFPVFSHSSPRRVNIFRTFLTRLNHRVYAWFFRISASNHREIAPRTYSICSSVSGRPFGIRCHFSRHPRQHAAVACWATKTGWPRIGVCRPSFFGSAGASRSRSNFLPCSNTTGSVFSARYARSFGPKRNRLRNRLFESAANRSSRSRMSACQKAIPSAESLVRATPIDRQGCGDRRPRGDGRKSAPASRNRRIVP